MFIHIYTRIYAHTYTHIHTHKFIISNPVTLLLITRIKEIMFTIEKITHKYMYCPTNYNKMSEI